MAVEVFGICQRVISAAYTALVGNHNELIAQSAEYLHGFYGSRQEFQLFGLIQIAEIYVDGTVSVKENSFIHVREIRWSTMPQSICPKVMCISWMRADSWWGTVNS